MKKISLTQNKVAIIDDEDYPLVSRFRWYAVRDRNNWYACSKVRKEVGWRAIYMHGLILGGKHIDHINQNGLDNQRNNLRFATKSLNQLNARTYSHNTSGQRGVVWHKQNQKWQAQIRIDGRYKYLGTFNSKSDAIAIRLKAEVPLQLI